MARQCLAFQQFTLQKSLIPARCRPMSNNEVTGSFLTVIVCKMAMVFFLRPTNKIQLTFKFSFCEDGLAQLDRERIVMIKLLHVSVNSAKSSSYRYVGFRDVGSRVLSRFCCVSFTSSLIFSAKSMRYLTDKAFIHIFVATSVI